MSFFVSYDPSKKMVNPSLKLDGNSRCFTYKKVQRQYDAMRPQACPTTSDAPPEFAKKVTPGFPGSSEKNFQPKPKADSYAAESSSRDRHEKGGSFEGFGMSIEDMMMFPMDPVEDPVDTHDTHQ